MRPGGDPRRRAATALVVLTLLPVAIMVGAAHAPSLLAPGAGSPGASGSLRAQDVDLPATEAFQRGQNSNLFAPFSWDGLVASGPFVRFDYLLGTGTILDYVAVNGTQTATVVESLHLDDFSSTSTPIVSGATFAVASNNAIVIAHDEPTALLEVRTLGQSQNVTLRFPADTTGLLVSEATLWPAASLSFSDGYDSGRLIVGHGQLEVNGTIVTASLAPYDYLALRAVPRFVEHAAERTAVLDAFASGHLAAEFDLVAVSDGGWLENSAQFQVVQGSVDSSVQFSRAAVRLNMPASEGGLVLLAFDPTTMPADATHSLVVRANGTVIPETSDPLASLFALPGSADHAAYARLTMNATVLAVYVPNLGSVSLQVQSVAEPAPGLDRPTQLAVVAAIFVVAVAAAVMFRRQPS